MAKSPAKTEKQQVSKFRPGKSGNPNGRPQGSRNKATLAVEALLDGQSEALTQKAVEMALTGDMQALKLCLERICPPRKDRPVTFALSEMSSSKDAVNAMAGILEAVAAGEITPDEANRIAGIIEVYRKTLETTELETRLQALEKVAENRTS